MNTGVISGRKFLKPVHTTTVIALPGVRVELYCSFKGATDTQMFTEGFVARLLNGFSYGFVQNVKVRLIKVK